MITVEKGDDFTFLLFDTMRIDPAGLEVGGAESLPSGYSPSSTASATSTGRARPWRGWRWCATPACSRRPPMPLLLRWRDPQGRERGTERVASDARGLAPFQLAAAGLRPDRATTPWSCWPARR